MSNTTHNRKGIFITLEGIEGAGKSTHARFIKRLLEEAGKSCILTREPGGTGAGENIREILLQRSELRISGLSELLLMFAARAQHLHEVILPALAEGKLVICDRFTDSSYAYQGGGRDVDPDKICALAKIVHPDFKPDLTLLFDVSPATGLERAGKSGERDRFESESLAFFDSVRKAYLRIAETEPERVFIIDAEADISGVETSIRQLLAEKNLC